MLRFVLSILFCLSLAAETATINVVLKPQCGPIGCSIYTVTFDNESPHGVTFSRGKVLIHAVGVTPLLKSQLTNHQSNGPIPVLARTAQELTLLAPGVLNGVGIATKNQSMGWAGFGLGFITYIVQRLTVRSQSVNYNDELPDTIALSPLGGAEYQIHTKRVPKNQAVPIVFQLTIPTP
jgi:hypothetical protein